MIKIEAPNKTVRETLRDYWFYEYVGRALQGILSNEAMVRRLEDDICSHAVMLADRQLQEIADMEASRFHLTEDSRGED